MEKPFRISIVNRDTFEVVRERDISLLDMTSPIESRGDAWSPILYAGEKRHSSAFRRADLAVLDVDGGLQIAEALHIFSPYRGLILPTKSHGIAKNGMVADRFRVIIPFERPIEDLETYLRTMLRLSGIWRFIDPSCTDAARLYFAEQTANAIPLAGRLSVGVDPHPLDDVSERRIALSVEAAADYLLFNDTPSEVTTVRAHPFGQTLFWVEIASRESGQKTYRRRLARQPTYSHPGSPVRLLTGLAPRESTEFVDGVARVSYGPAIETRPFGFMVFPVREGFSEDLQRELGAEVISLGERFHRLWIPYSDDPRLVPGLLTVTKNILALAGGMRQGDLERLGPSGLSVDFVPAEVEALSGLHFKGEPLTFARAKALYRRLVDEAPESPTLALSPFRGKIPETLLETAGRSETSERILRAILSAPGLRRIVWNEPGTIVMRPARLSTTVVSRGLGLSSSRQVSRVLSRLVEAGFLRAVEEPIRHIRSRAYLPTERFVRVMADAATRGSYFQGDSLAGLSTVLALGPAEVVTRRREPIGEPEDGKFNHYIFVNTCFFSTREAFISYMWENHGDFIRAKPERASQMENAWRSHQTRLRLRGGAAA